MINGDTFDSNSHFNIIKINFKTYVCGYNRGNASNLNEEMTPRHISAPTIEF